MKRVLIITYYWIPSGGAGVQRWIKFTKYLREFGWEPIIYTPENPEYPSTDHSFEKDIANDITIVKTPIWEPYNIYRTLTGKKGQPINAGFITEGKKAGWKENLSIRIRGNFLIPDPRRFWIRPSVDYLKDYITQHPVDAVISTGPPHSMHMIALGLKKFYPTLPWIADFRDPWTNIDFYHELGLCWLSDKIHHRFEKKVVQTCDCLVTVSDGWMEGFKALNPKQTKVIQNGYDSDDIHLEKAECDAKFSISHIGTLNAARNPATLWKALRELCRENTDFCNDLVIQLVGKVDYSVLENITNEGLNNNLIKIDYLSHNEAIAKQQSSRLLLLLINNTPNSKGILTGKFYEYLASQRPILAIGPTDGDAAAVLHDAQAGEMVEFDDLKTTKEVVMAFYRQYKTNTLTVATGSVERYSRRSLTGELSTLLNKLTTDKK